MEGVSPKMLISFSRAESLGSTVQLYLRDICAAVFLSTSSSDFWYSCASLSTVALDLFLSAAVSRVSEQVHTDSEGNWGENWGENWGDINVTTSCTVDWGVLNVCGGHFEIVKQQHSCCISDVSHMG
eukprot:scaffold15520_cov76-Skeletonema_marinoi.AAC.4